MQKITINRLLFQICFVFILTQLYAQPNKMVNVFSKSIDFEKEKQYPPAIDLIKSLNDSNSYSINIRLAWLYYKMGANAESIKYYKKASRLAPDAIEPKYGMGFPAYAIFDTKNLIEHNKKILDVDPNNSIINGNLGSMYYYNKDYTNALPYLQKVVSLYPFDYDNNLLLAWTYARLNKFEEAQKYFNVVLLYAPKDASALEGLLFIKKEVSNADPLRNAFMKSYDAVELSKTPPDYKAALVPLKEVYDKNNYFMNLRMGWMCYHSAMHQDAANYFKIANDLMSESFEAKFGQASPTEILGNKTELRTIYESILKIQPLNTYAHYKIGLLDYQNKEYDKAFAHFDKINKLYPSDVDALLMLGWTALQMSKTTDSQNYFNTALCFSPGNQSAIRGLTSKPDSEMKNNNPLIIKKN